MSARLRGLYAITPDTATGNRPGGPPLDERVGEAIRGGARLIQYRNKGSDPARRLAEASALARLCQAADIPLIVNDDLELAAAAGAQGVHIGRDDPDPQRARAYLGPEAIVGVSCYDSLELGLEAERAGADYVAFGSFFHSPTKPDAARPTLDLLSAARARLSIPVVAIGGITPENARLAIAAGADLLAVVTGVFAARDIAEAARAYSQLFVSQGESPPEYPR